MSSSVDFVKLADALTLAMNVPTHDDGSLAPLLVRLAWHTSGTFDKDNRSCPGGSNGCTIRTSLESRDPANNGLELARMFLEPFKTMFAPISYADLYTFAGCVAIKALGGPAVKWRPGRIDKNPKTLNPADIPVGRLPDALKDAAHVRQVFSRMGFSDRETVALIGAHAVGRCHRDRSGFEGPWTLTPLRFSNQYFKLLVRAKWRIKSWDGNLQFEDESKQLMMLNTDIELIKDPIYRKYCQEFAENNDTFLQAFADAFSRLLDLGVNKANI